MRKAKLLVIKKDYVGNQVIENVIGYTLDSIFAEHDDILSAHLNTESYQSIVNDFYRTQAHLDMTKRRRLFHFLLSTPAAKDMERTLSEGAKDLRDYFDNLGHQVLLVPHNSSEHNCLHYHWHVIVNAVSCTTGKVLSDNAITFNSIISFLNLTPFTEWTWSYKVR